MDAQFMEYLVIENILQYFVEIGVVDRLFHFPPHWICTTSIIHHGVITRKHDSHRRNVRLGLYLSA